MNNFSPNMLKTFDECQMKFFFKYIKRLSVPQNSEFFEKGKKIHALANYYLKGENIDEMEKVLNADEKIAWESLKSSKYFKFEVVGTEYNLSCKIGDYWVGGRLDAFIRNNSSSVLKTPSPVREDETALNLSTFQLIDLSTFYILDYKTGNIPKNAEMDFQTVIYLLCADKFLKHKQIDYKSLQFVYIGLKKDVEQSIIFDETLKKAYEERVMSTCDRIIASKNLNNFVKNTLFCESCEYNKICN